MPANLEGIYAAVVTPYGDDGAPSEEQLASCLRHLAENGGHGALVAGTTGEAPSLNVAERAALFRMARKTAGDLRLMAGTGAASLTDAAAITAAAYDAGMDAAMVIAPFFYKKADDDGLFAFYAALIERAVPSDGRLFLYHNPVVAANGLSIELIKRIRDAYPRNVVGIKDSSQDWPRAQRMFDELPDFAIYLGDDRLLSSALRAGAAGGISLVANAFPGMLRDVYNRHHAGQSTEEAQERLDATHRLFDDLPSIAAIKAVLAAGGIIQNAAVRPPLRGLTPDETAILNERFMIDQPIPGSVSLQDLIDLTQDQ
jgi:4-hydroxy-tetrahydrodipicolinate synthase